MTASARTTTPPTGGLYRNLWRFSAGSRVALVGGASLLIASQLLRLALPWFAGQAINVLQAGGPDFALHAGGWVCALLATSMGAWALHGPGRVLERTVGVRVRRGVSGALFDKLAAAPLKWHDGHPASDLQQRMSQASGALDGFAQNQYVILHGVVTFVGTLGALVVFSPSIGLLAVVAYALLVWVGMRFDRSMTVLAAAQNDAERRFSSGALQFVGSIVTVSALRLEASTRRMLDGRLDAVFAPLKRSVRLNEAKWCAVELMTLALTWSVVALYVWQRHASGAGVLIGGAFMVYQYAGQAGGVVSTAASQLQGFAHSRVDFASADVIWDAPSKPARPARLDDDWTRIELHGVGYRHEAPAVADGAPRGPSNGIGEVSLVLERGERIALVGPSGSGKSTLLRVMAGLYEAQRGHLTIDGVSHLGIAPLSTVSTLIPQDAEVFETSARDNIAPEDDVDAARLQAALRISAFDEVLATLPDGLATPIAERGTNLSGGQRQRLCLARGIVAAANSSLILLDEPTSALDPMTEAHVVRSLKAGFPSATIVASVHRMSLLEHFDRVVLMVAGQVVDSGTIDELRHRQPLFAAMLQGQAAPIDQVREAA